MSKALICWDSNVLIDFLSDDNTENISSINAVAAEIEAGKYFLGFSVVVYVELLECTMPAGALEKCQSFLKRSEIVGVFPIDLKIAEEAQKIRNNVLKKYGRSYASTPDMLHVATAVFSKAKVLHTFDKKLLELSGTEEVEGLAITKCQIPGEDGVLDW